MIQIGSIIILSLSKITYSLPEQSIRQIAYISSFYQDLSDQQLHEMARQCHVCDEFSPITGLLIYREGCIFGVVEGPYNVIDQYYREMEQDELHHEMIKVFDRLMTHRDFQFWNFAFVNYEYSIKLYAKLNAEEKKFCSKDQILQFDKLVSEMSEKKVDFHDDMSQQVINLIKTFEKTILRDQVPQHKKNISNMWSRPTLSRSNTSFSSE